MLFFRVIKLRVEIVGYPKKTQCSAWSKTRDVVQGESAKLYKKSTRSTQFPWSTPVSYSGMAITRRDFRDGLDIPKLGSPTNWQVAGGDHSFRDSLYHATALHAQKTHEIFGSSYIKHRNDRLLFREKQSGDCDLIGSDTNWVIPISTKSPLSVTEKKGKDRTIIPEKGSGTLYTTLMARETGCVHLNVTEEITNRITLRFDPDLDKNSLQKVLGKTYKRLLYYRLKAYATAS